MQAPEITERLARVLIWPSPRPNRRQDPPLPDTDLAQIAISNVPSNIALETGSNGLVEELVIAIVRGRGR
jgi:hypothetical protein